MAQGNRLTRFVYDRSPAFVRDWAITRFSSRRGKAKFGPRYHEALTDLARTQWYTPERAAELQAEKLRKLVHYAVAHVPYYRDLFRQLDLRPDAIDGPADLRRLPVIEKADVRAHQDALRSDVLRNAPGLERLPTSGTSGHPLEIAIDPDCLQIEKAFTWLHRGWGGVHLGDLTAAFAGFLVAPVGQRRPPFWVHDRSENRVIYSVQHLSRSHLPAYADSLRHLAPVMIYGYPTAIYLVAMYLNEQGIGAVRPRAVFTNSETLMPHQRAEIERAFGCRVFDWYGATELVANIVQCEHGSYHVKPEYGVVEVLRRDGSPAAPGEAGDLVGTGLNNLAMPLLRYRVGDSVVPRAGTCPCGRNGALVEGIVGRVEDVVVTPDGRWLTRLDHVFKGLYAVEEAQLVQETTEELRVRIVRRPGYGDGDEAAVLHNLRERLGDEIRIRFEYLDRIPRTSSGKFRYVVSKVRLDAADARQAGEIVGITGEEERTL
ncbi:MAG: hypothetical protein R6X25_06840 [Candidatus Krumholzibacteriia bacterium]